MLKRATRHNLFTENVDKFVEQDPHLHFLATQTFAFESTWWRAINFNEPGIYILTGGRQVGKSTSCKQLILNCIHNKDFARETIFYLPCDEIFDVKELGIVIRDFISTVGNAKFLLIVDEITFIPGWERLIKSLADEGVFRQGLCLLTGSDTLMLKEASMSFPGRRGNAPQVDFHLYPLSFAEYVGLVHRDGAVGNDDLERYFKDYLKSGGYLRAINNLADKGEVLDATYFTYEQWIRGDFLKQKKNEEYLLVVLQALFTIGVSPTSYSKLTQKIGLLSKETCINYCNLLERMDVLLTLQAYDQNKKQGFPRKNRKFHFFDPFIWQTIYRWLQREGYLNDRQFEEAIVEAIVASHCARVGKSFYFKGQGEVDVIWLKDSQPHAIEVKWTEQSRPLDLKTLKQFANPLIVTKHFFSGEKEGIPMQPIYQFLYEIHSAK